MIQRKQSIFLALVVILFVALLFLPVYDFIPLAERRADPDGKMLSIPLLLIPMALIALLAVVAIFMYKNRPLQARICRAGLILSLLMSVNAIIFPQFFVHSLPKGAISVTSGAYLLPVNIILFALAAFFIKKDEDLVKAADRLR